MRSAKHSITAETIDTNGRERPATISGARKSHRMSSRNFSGNKIMIIARKHIVAIALVLASTSSGFAQTSGPQVDPARAAAIRDCNIRAQVYVLYAWGNVQLYVICVPSLHGRATSDGIDQDFCDHSRQCVGRTSIRRLLSALTHPPRTRRQGKPTARAPFVSMTASSKSRLNGAVDISCHMKSHQKNRKPA